MFADERKAHIVAYLNQHKRVTVADLAQIFSSSESTIRRDLQELEELGQLKRTHGGAIAAEIAGFEPTYQEKNVQNSGAKERIGQLAAGMVKDGEIVLLDAGTTTIQIAKHISARNVTVVTNSVAIAAELQSNPTVHVVMLGGELRQTTGALVGPFTEQMLSQLHVDVLFLGANGIHPGGVTTPNAVEAATKRAMVTSAKRTIVVADATKVSQVSFVQVCPLNRIDGLITDEQIDDSPLVQALVDFGVRVTAADDRDF
ncbi:DeoR/GlpR family DNA-binding transcription regulator [Alicyclobacillus fastidiosus]|uniref:DeoR/GlpR family DNA-binding transcription regulator n=1 Tax=Alicyclobacillus fastidiosus TaxID=392011 RepID=A0ABY6ZFE2_9BACL|nr:DeoR/GlpR family DNA-binding transcription regulator [Alicyclobacillus fastidiosus]WAH40941.1 DeoR/GlpR family DNA-binding transcription regulator [Alicyclobacillus fastidiosus]GMA62447.1 DeoR family transcriptional regulator [Alicyclobacillus fastidiosus]